MQNIQEKVTVAKTLEAHQKYMGHLKLWKYLVIS